jgi:Domain of unknown function (DUF4164)
MTEQNAVEAASRRLALALEALAAAVERRREAAKGETNLTAQLHALGTDRARLASELDVATAQVKSLQAVDREVGERLDHLIATIRALLAADEPG